MPGRNLLVRLLRLAQRQLLGEIDDAVELRVVLFQAREIELRQLARRDLPALDERDRCVSGRNASASSEAGIETVDRSAASAVVARSGVSFREGQD